MQPNFQEVAATAARQASSLVPAWLPRGRRQGKYWLAHNPKRNDKRLGSFRVNLLTGQWGDFATGHTGGDLISLKAYLLGSSQWQACELLSQELGYYPSITAPQHTHKDTERWKAAASIWADWCYFLKVTGQQIAQNHY